MSAFRDAIEEVFRGEALVDAIPAYSLRGLQLDMACAVGAALERGGLHLFEAGTGIGKSLAYLVPALLSGQKTFISTATITLQDQLAGKDAPAVLQALSCEAKVTVLKGRNNYLCLRKWRSGAGRLDMPEDFPEWADGTETGDVASFGTDLPGGFWRHYRSDVMDCIGSSCRERSACHFYRARMRARKADILILNHHLLVSGLLSGDALPEADMLVIDEGHRLEDAASECMGIALGQGTLLPIFDGIAFSEVEAERKAVLLELARRLSEAVSGLTEGVTVTGVWDPVEHLEGITAVLDAASALRTGAEGCEELLPVSQAASAVASSATALTRMSTEVHCCFVEAGGRHPVLRAVPLDVGPDLSDKVYGSFDTTIVTSATLTVAGEFGFYRDRLGAGEALTRSFGSPFHYPEQAVLSVPDDLPPHDRHEELAASVWDWGKRLAGALGGRTLLLFTSYRNLELVRKLSLADPPGDLRIMAQGDMSRNAILDEFRRDSRAVILGTSSFWEGVDLPGEMLQAVVIDRLPFSSPGHPLIRARMDLIERSGGSSFARYSLPLAAVRLRQGVGRLIRSSTDTGVVLIMDRRINSRGYGRIFIDSLPPFGRVAEDGVLPFIMEHCRPGGVSSPEE